MSITRHGVSDLDSVPATPNYPALRLAGVSATLTSTPSTAHTGSPPSSTADGAPSPTSGPAASQNSSSSTPGGTLPAQYSVRAGSSGEFLPATGVCRTIVVQAYWWR